MELGVRVRVSAEPRLNERRISLVGEGNALYPVLCSLLYRFLSGDREM